MSEQTAENDYIEPPRQHECNLPAYDHDREVTTLARCRECGRWYHWNWPANDFPGSFMRRQWNPVRWHHFGLRRRIKDHALPPGEEAL